jgi:D-galacturonate reductase
MDGNGSSGGGSRRANNTAINVLMIGTGEYTTGFVQGSPSKSDKAAGVVALTMFDLRRRGKVGQIGLCGTNGLKFEGIRAHMKQAIEGVYKDMNIECTTYPKDDEVNSRAYITAIDNMHPGDIAIIFTPDDTHFEIALAAISRGLHVLVTKPIVQTLEHHRILYEEAKKKNVLVAIEVHKRWDPMYADARDRIRQLGPFSYFYAYMSQPKHQLDTFKAWAGKSSDISYYLNSHHIDFHEWCVGHMSRPVRVSATACTGIATSKDIQCEDTITLTVQWENIDESSLKATSLGTAIYTSSWTAPKSDVHSQQRFFYMGHKGEVNIDQAHRGYSMSDDASGFRSINPLFMKYAPTDGYFSGQSSYGYKSFEMFIDAVSAINSGELQPSDCDKGRLATLTSTFQTTAILEAGRRSLDNNNRSIEITYPDDKETGEISFTPNALRVI